jgi:hypothetical protein
VELGITDILVELCGPSAGEKEAGIAITAIASRKQGDIGINGRRNNANSSSID